MTTERRLIVKRDCIVCGNQTPAIDEAWGVAICGACAMDVMAPLVGRALVLDSRAGDSGRRQVQVIGRLRDAVRGAEIEQARGLRI